MRPTPCVHAYLAGVEASIHEHRSHVGVVHGVDVDQGQTLTGRAGGVLMENTRAQLERTTKTRRKRMNELPRDGSAINTRYDVGPSRWLQRSAPLRAFHVYLADGGASTGRSRYYILQSTILA